MQDGGLMQANRTFLSRFSVQRKAGWEIPGKYDPTLQMWTTITGTGVVPIIESDDGLAELITKTHANMEEDKVDSYSVGFVRSAMTQTASERSARTPSALLEITTKTDAELERDDTAPGVEGFL
jgi:hypothetical protein